MLYPPSPRRRKRERRNVEVFPPSPAKEKRVNLIARVELER